MTNRKEEHHTFQSRLSAATVRNVQNTEILGLFGSVRSWLVLYLAVAVAIEIGLHYYRTISFHSATNLLLRWYD